MTENNQKICNLCLSKDEKIANLEKQTKDLVAIKEKNASQIAEITSQKKETQAKLSQLESKVFFAKMDGKNDRFEDFQKLVGDDEFQKWDEVKTRQFTEKYSFLFNEKAKDPKLVSEANSNESGQVKTDPNIIVGIDDDLIVS